MNTRTITESLRDAAIAQGFSHFGVARAEALSPEGARLNEWIARGYHAGMRFMERAPERRSDPCLVLDGARSVVMLAYNYFTRQACAEGGRKISRYAWGEDYHSALAGKVTVMEETVRTLVPGAITKSYIDTGPVMEKAWAMRAGLGWIGKNACLITRDLGSWVFLASIITTVDFEYNDPFSDFCGRCTRCMDACPTKAIVEPRVVDSAKCISWLTIEKKGDDDPAEEVPRYRDWIFGCDVCQDVCPWNRFELPAADEAFAPKAGRLHLVDEDFFALDQASFLEVYRGSPLLRPGLKGMQRNIRRLTTP